MALFQITLNHVKGVSKDQKQSFKDHDVYIINFLEESYFNWFRFEKKKKQNLKSSYLHYFMKKNHEI